VILSSSRLCSHSASILTVLNLIELCKPVLLSLRILALLTLGAVSTPYALSTTLAILASLRSVWHLRRVHSVHVLRKSFQIFACEPRWTCFWNVAGWLLSAIWVNALGIVVKFWALVILVGLTLVLDVLISTSVAQLRESVLLCSFRSRYLASFHPVFLDEAPLLWSLRLPIEILHTHATSIFPLKS